MQNSLLSNLNLDDENQVKNWIEKFGTLRGRRLANQLGLKGKGAVKTANALSNYAWNKHTAIDNRKRGMIITAQNYEKICQAIYIELPSKYRW
jgi:hypothetical protein